MALLGGGHRELDHGAEPSEEGLVDILLEVGREHGAAFDIMGKGIANPLATVSAVAMMLDHLGEQEAAQRVDNAVAKCLEQRTVLTVDLGGTASTSEMGDEAARLISEW